MARKINSAGGTAVSSFILTLLDDTTAAVARATLVAAKKLSGSDVTVTTTNGPALDTAVQNTSGPLEVKIRCGVVAAPGQNGHMYFEISPDNVTWYSSGGYVACRNNQAVGTGGTAPVGGGTGHIGAGGTVGCVVPDTWYYRIRTSTASGYSTPTFVYDNPGCMTTVQVGGWS